MKLSRSILLISLIISFLFVSCNINSTENNTSSRSSSETVFEVTVPEEINEGEAIYFEILDEVTGVSLNPKRYVMEKKDNFNLYVRILLIEGSLIHYRYVRHSDIDQIEFNGSGEPIYYRTYFVDHPAVIIDKVASWSDEGTPFKVGEISGFVFDKKTDLPLVGVYVSINGLTVMSGSDGFYEIGDIPVGEYSLVAYHPDDFYEPFEQGAIIAENSVTPASFGMKQAKMVNITFNLEVPENTVAGAPVRFLGDSASLGNIFAESKGGTSVIASRAPIMEYVGNDKYKITLLLAAGSDLRYKYSLGDGFFNAERSDEGVFNIRQLIVPKKDMTIKDQVFKWASGESQPITFEVSAPDNTPANDVVSIQFNPYIWMRPIQMWKTGENNWTYTLYGPFEYLVNSQFRFCRNDLCGYADDISTIGENGTGYLLNLDTSDEPRSISYQIEGWNYFNDSIYQVENNRGEISNPAFIKGIQFSPVYDPGYLPFLDQSFIDIAVNGANLIIFSPTRTIKGGTLPTIKFDPIQDISNSDLDKMNTYAQEAGLQEALFPHLASEFNSMNDFWNSTSPSYNWWLEWFSQYERFILDQAVIAEENGLSILIIGGQSILPALPSGKLPNGNISNTPYDFNDKWRDLINKIRGKYSGQIVFAIPSSISDQVDYAFLMDVDAFLVENDAPLTSSTSPGIEELTNRFRSVLDNSIYKLVERFQKPIILGVDYASIDGSASNCLNLDSSCQEIYNSTTLNDLPIDLNEQADVYTAVFDATLERQWIIGIVSQDYFPAAEVLDFSPSIRGKPAMDVVSYFYNSIIR